ncbi:hypothetical protein BaRGS_00020654 [Batillaria attramentaria]|uniref:Uncharacterized protein n=1 Tax=Batillaria attramentaria TaxID=370345 RepID=A0ABD0KLF2_9CAEN
MPSLLLVVVGLVVLAGDCVQGKVDYRCRFGPMLSATDDAGVTHYFCATEMDPPFMQRGQYLVTRDAQNTCYECVCEDEIGMACCESERPVMHV